MKLIAVRLLTFFLVSGLFLVIGKTFEIPFFGYHFSRSDGGGFSLEVSFLPFLIGFICAYAIEKLFFKQKPKGIGEDKK